MSTVMFRRLRTRQPPTFLASSVRSILRPATQIPRYYATTTQCDTPNASNVSSPQSSSAEESDVKTSRSTDSTPNQDNASVQSPISEGNLQSEGAESPDNDEMKQDPDKPASQKKEQVEGLGKKPMGPEDYQ